MEYAAANSYAKNFVMAAMEHVTARHVQHQSSQQDTQPVASPSTSTRTDNMDITLGCQSAETGE